MSKFWVVLCTGLWVLLLIHVKLPATSQNPLIAFNANVQQMILGFWHTLTEGQSLLTQAKGGGLT